MDEIDTQIGQANGGVNACLLCSESGSRSTGWWSGVPAKKIASKHRLSGRLIACDQPRNHEGIDPLIWKSTFAVNPGYLVAYALPLFIETDHANMIQARRHLGSCETSLFMWVGLARRDVSNDMHPIAI